MVKKIGFSAIILVLVVFVAANMLSVNVPVQISVSGQKSSFTELKVPPGYEISLYAKGLSRPRFMELTKRGDLLVTQPKKGNVLLLLKDEDNDGLSDGQRILLEGLNLPHDTALFEGWLYVAETDAISRIRFDENTGETSGELEAVVTGLPGGGNHWTRTIAFGPDGWLYLSLGSSCNVCLEDDPRRAAITRYRPDGTEEQVFAAGLRNSVGFDWSPADGGLYATDNGRDWLGDNFPPDELNLVEEGGFYGWPFASGNRTPDPDYGKGQAALIEQSVAPAHYFPAHNAPLGILFLRHQAASQYANAALVALHGSWNRSEKDGYKVVSLHWRDDGRIQSKDFVTGFLKDDDVSGRPVAFAESGSGVIYISDDYAGNIYQIKPIE